MGCRAGRVAVVWAGGGGCGSSHVHPTAQPRLRHTHAATAVRTAAMCGSTRHLYSSSSGLHQVGWGGPACCKGHRDSPASSNPGIQLDTLVRSFHSPPTTRPPCCAAVLSSSNSELQHGTLVKSCPAHPLTLSTPPCCAAVLDRVATSEGPTLQATVLLSTSGQAPAGTLSMAEQAKVGGPTLRCAVHSHQRSQGSQDTSCSSAWLTRIELVAVGISTPFYGRPVLCVAGVLGPARPPWLGHPGC